MKFIRTLLIALLLVTPLLFIGGGQVSALSEAKQQDCYDKHNGKTYRAGSDKLNGNCYKRNGGNCTTENIGDNKRKVTCKKPGGGTTSVDVPGISDSCTNPEDVCVKGLPSTTANQGAVKNILSIVIGIIAAIAVLFVAIGGLRYVLSQGDPQAVSKAKSTIVYALIGLAFAVFAQVIVVVVARIAS